MKSPEKIEVPTWREFCCGGSDADSKKHCMVEWANVLFASKKALKPVLDGDRGLDDPLDGMSRAYKALREAVEENNVNAGCQFRDWEDWEDCRVVIDFNDSSKPRERARVFELALEKLGYEICA